MLRPLHFLLSSLLSKRTVTFDPDTGEGIDEEFVRRGRADAFSEAQICALLEP
jgi:hypothetical protein